MHGFWQIPLTEQSRKYTAFITEFGPFQFKGPAVISLLTRKVFVNTPNVYTFLDDVLIATPALEEYFETLNNVFTLLSNANLKINLKKSYFCAESIHFLGQTLNSEFVHPQLKKIDAINNFVLPKTKKQLQSFLGFCNYYRNYVKNYANIASKLYDLVKKSSPKVIVWSDEYLFHFNNLKDALSQDIKLFHVDPNEPFMLQTDASSYAVGAVLGQRLSPNGPVLPIQLILLRFILYLHVLIVINYRLPLSILYFGRYLIVIHCLGFPVASKVLTETVSAMFCYCNIRDEMNIFFLYTRC